MRSDNKNTFPILIAIGLASAGVILAEISLTRIFSVTIWYHFSFVAISLVMLGMAGSAVFVHSFQKREKIGSLNKMLPKISLTAAFAFIIGLAIYLSFNFRNIFSGDNTLVFRLIPTLIFFPGFYLVGIVICSLITRYAAYVNKLYFADLACAGLAGASSVFLLEFLSGPLVFVVSAILIALSAFFIPTNTNDRSKTKKIWYPGIAAALLLFIFIFNSLKFFDVKYGKSHNETKYEKIYEKWSALSRVTVFKNRWFKKDRPYGWGLSKKYNAPPIEEMWMQQDGSAGSPITKTDGNLEKLDFLDWDVTSIAYSIRDYNRVCVIGLGGGRDVLLALKHKANDVVGIEINKDISDLVTGRFANYVGNVFNKPPVKIVTADGRAYIE